MGGPFRGAAGQTKEDERAVAMACWAKYGPMFDFECWGGCGRVLALGSFYPDGQRVCWERQVLCYAGSELFGGFAVCERELEVFKECW